MISNPDPNSTDYLYRQGVKQGRTDTLEAVREAIEPLLGCLDERVMMCQEHNGMAICKNCGLSRSDWQPLLQALTKMENGDDR